MKIGFDAKRIVRNHTGLGSYSRTLVNALAALDTDDELLLYAPDEGDPQLRRQIEPRHNVRFVYPSRPLPFGGKLGMAARWREKTIVEQLKADGIELYHGLSGELPAGLKESGIRSIVTIHDLIFLRHPEYYHWWDTLLYRQKFLRTLKEADRIVAISECTKRDILHYGHFPEDRIDIIYQSCSTRFAHPADEHISQRVHAEYDLPAHYILSVGTIEERKNILLAVKALRHLPADLSLVVLGRPTKYLDKVRRYIAEQQLDHRVRFLHGVPNDALPAIYQMAAAFVYPSRYEGFGIPIIEAIQSGLPVVAAKGSCLEEAGGPASLYVDPDDDRALAEALLTALAESDSRVAASRDYVRRFENSDVARQMMDEYRLL
ncbi:MAG: glycosyltransferase family 4 protein [Prevotella sp.]|nr:glycosyltransferase family 4 protein [Prevotella sp.]MBQ9532798.1 glycosyltransferase family 4 protein [Prevotella sp.]